MSYCTARRLQLTAHIARLQQSLAELRAEGASSDLLLMMEKRLLQALHELVTVGDCGD